MRLHQRLPVLGRSCAFAAQSLRTSKKGMLAATAEEIDADVACLAAHWKSTRTHKLLVQCGFSTPEADALITSHYPAS